MITILSHISGLPRAFNWWFSTCRFKWDSHDPHPWHEIGTCFPIKKCNHRIDESHKLPSFQNMIIGSLTRQIIKNTSAIAILRFSFYISFYFIHQGYEAVTKKLSLYFLYFRNKSYWWIQSWSQMIIIFVTPEQG